MWTLSGRGTAQLCVGPDPWKDPVPPLSKRTIRNAYLLRQDLVTQAGRGVLSEVEHLVGIQSQSPTAPFFALHSRVQNFCPEELSSLVSKKNVVRLCTMRGTLHSVSAKHATALRVLTQPALNREYDRVFAKGLEGLQPEHLRREITALLDGRALTTKDLVQELHRRWPGYRPTQLMGAARCLVPLMQLPPRGTWGARGQPTYGLVHQQIPHRTRPVNLQLPDLIRMYLKAYGPATIQDFQQWSGLTGTVPHFAHLSSELRQLVGEDGDFYFDLPRSARPQQLDLDRIVLLAPFDNALLSHKRRDRIISPARHAAITTANGIVPGTFLKRGQVAGTWAAVAHADWLEINIQSFEPLLDLESEQLRQELLAMSTNLYQQPVMKIANRQRTLE